MNAYFFWNQVGEPFVFGTKWVYLFDGYHELSAVIHHIDNSCHLRLRKEMLNEENLD